MKTGAKGYHMDNLIKIASNSLIVWLGALGLVVGFGMFGYSVITGPPTRASLQTVEGTISEASRVTRRSRRTGSTNSYFEMTLKPVAGAADLKLRVPTIEMAEPDVRSLIGRPVRAEFDSEQDVYVLRSGNREVLTFENTMERRKLSFRQYYVDGIALVIGGSVLLVIGFLLGLRKLRKQASAGGRTVEG